MSASSGLRWSDALGVAAKAMVAALGPLAARDVQPLTDENRAKRT